MNLRAFRKETFATPLAAPRESRTPTFSAHASAKTVLLFPGSL